MPRVSLMRGLVSWEVNPLDRAVIKISDILRAATVTTGAKMIPMILLILKYSSKPPIEGKLLKLALRMINGEATI